MKQLLLAALAVAGLGFWMGTGCDSTAMANAALNAALAGPDTSGYEIVPPLVALGSIYDN